MSSTAPGTSVLRFGPFEFEVRNGLLRKAGKRVQLQPQPAKILALLVSRPTEVITREELRQEIWGQDTFVDFEHNLNFSVRQIRAALHDDAERPRFIETLPRRGYRFIAQVEFTKQAEALPVTQSRPVALLKDSAAAKNHSFRSFLVAPMGLIGIVALLAGFYGVRLRDHRSDSLNRPPIQSIAILPLQNLSGDPGEEYFVDGLAEQLTTELGKISALRVTSRTSTAGYRNTKKTLRQIANELEVDAVVEGSLVRSGDRVRINVKLIQALTDRQLWANSYERDAGEVIEMEDEVALAIAHEVSARLTPAEQMILANNRRTNAQAYDAYLHGRYLWNERTAESITEAVGYFEQALHEDPNFALAYSGLADCNSVGWGAKKDFPQAEQFARKALALQPDLAEGHASLAFASEFQYKFADVENELRRAIESNPSYAMAHHFYAGHFLIFNRLTDALAESDRARQLDPFSLPINVLNGVILTELRQYDRAVKQLERTAAISPKMSAPHDLLARIYWIEQRVPEALAEEKKSAILAYSPTRLHDVDDVAAAYARSGVRVALIRSAQLKQKGYGRNYQALDIAFQYGSVQDKRKVLGWLNQAFRNGDDRFIMLLKSAPEFDFVRSDPRFQDLLRRIGLPP